jgi:hypothetical protein
VQIRDALVACCACAVTAGLAVQSFGAVITENAAAPNTNILASQLTDLGPGTLDSARDFADNGGPPGQTFTLASSATITSVTLKGGGSSSSTFNNGTVPYDGTETWGVQIGSVNTGTGAITPLGSETATGFTSTVNITNYLTFSLATPISVGAGTYAFSIYIAGPNGNTTFGGWFGIAHSASDAYANGTAFNYNTSTSSPTGNTGGNRRTFTGNGFVAPNPGGYDYAFAVQGTVPEPATFGIVSAVGLLGLTRRRR